MQIGMFKQFCRQYEGFGDQTEKAHLKYDMPELVVSNEDNNNKTLIDNYDTILE